MLWSVGCYAVPDSPIPMDLYENNTDTVLGANRYYSLRQRYINSGYIMGTVKEMRELFARAEEMVEAHKDHVIYNGSDQALFVIIFGQQEFVREQLRRKHITRQDKLMHPLTWNQNTPLTLQGIIIDDVLNPSFSHESFTPKPDTQYEFGVGLDYWSDLGHQTMNSDIGRDSTWLSYKDSSYQNMRHQIKENKVARDMFGCKLRLIEELPEDVTTGLPPMGNISASEANTPTEALARWKDLSLYTHLCLGTLPVMIHHNGAKGNREKMWTKLWLQPYARKLLEAMRRTRGPAYEIDTLKAFKENPGLKNAGGAWVDKGKGGWIDWPDMCPDSEYAGE
ncbi:hypothetical protein LTS18_001805, partial [Coniosporium uncinatum]